MTFIDFAEIKVTAGNGGSGCVAFRREKYVPKGGPSGGDGGRGGDVLAVADPHIQTLLDFKYKSRYQAKRGQHGQGDKKTGKSGESITINLPVGTVIKDIETGNVLGDLARPGETILLAKGGRGGQGNARYVTPTNRAPREWQVGEEGESRIVILELKLIADVGLVGLPNAGKSTLLSRISAAKPKIADYPFTTLVPNLGIVPVGDFGSFVVADIPGLIQGAHEGKGLGIQFLRHVERTRVLVLVLDASSQDLKSDYKTLIDELKSYGQGLIRKPRMIMYNKSDLVSSSFQPLVESEIAGEEYILVSAVTGDNLPQMIQKMWHLLQSES